ncbi:MAG: IS1595 family transposase [Candidatus Krumholzibacteria bacterium]
MKKKKNSKVAGDKCKVIAEIPIACQDEQAAVEFLEKHRWSDDPCCPRCGSVSVYQMVSRTTGRRNARYLWMCRDCKRQYTVRIGTVFEDSRIPLKHWCYAFWAACASKKGVSALQIKRMTGLSYKSALFMMHRIRYAMADDPKTPRKLTGVVECDETYVGGRPRYPKKGMGKSLDWMDRKTPVLAMVERGGNARAMAIPNVKGVTLWTHLRRHIDQEATLMTDELHAYKRIGKPFKKHYRIKHGLGQYVKGDVHTNTVEGFFSLLKRGIIGTFHSVSKKHLHRYVAEFEFRYNTRRQGDGERLAKAIKSAQGKRLKYKDQVS